MRGAELKVDLKRAPEVPLPDLYVMADQLLEQLDEVDEWLGSGSTNGLPKRLYKTERAAKIARKNKLSAQYRALKRIISTRHRDEFTIGKDATK